MVGKLSMLDIGNWVEEEKGKLEPVERSSAKCDGSMEMTEDGSKFNVAGRTSWKSLVVDK
jgi:hypothetical protein